MPGNCFFLESDNELAYGWKEDGAAAIDFHGKSIATGTNMDIPKERWHKHCTTYSNEVGRFKVSLLTF